MAGSVTTEAYKKLRDSVLNGEIPPGEIILEMDIAERYGISKITARQIIQMLCAEKYLKSFPRRGYLINEFTHAQIQKIQQVRYQIEAFAIRCIIKKCTDKQIQSLNKTLDARQNGNDPYATSNSRFHLKLAELAQNEYVYDAIYTYLGYTCRYAITAVRSDQYAEFSNCHAEIIHAMMDRNEKAALTALRIDFQLSETDV